MYSLPPSFSPGRQEKRRERELWCILQRDHIILQEKTTTANMYLKNFKDFHLTLWTQKNETWNLILFRVYCTFFRYRIFLIDFFSFLSNSLFHVSIDFHQLNLWFWFKEAKKIFLFYNNQLMLWLLVRKSRIRLLMGSPSKFAIRRRISRNFCYCNLGAKLVRNRKYYGPEMQQ